MIKQNKKTSVNCLDTEENQNNAFDVHHHQSIYFLNIPTNFYSISLSQRELLCCFHSFRGQSAKEIGKLLRISPRTVEGYLRSLRKKLGCRNRVELTDKILPNFTFEKFIQLSIITTKKS